MRYAYYPGCSLDSSARDYDESARAVMAALGVELEDLQDWNCCGGGAVSSVDPDLALAFSARNIALAEEKHMDLATSCAACYTNLRRARTFITGKTPAGDRLRGALAEVNRHVAGTAQVKHILEILLHDVGLKAIKVVVTQPLAGLKVAAYYGCQLGRPAGGFIHPEIPTQLDDLVAALGATPVAWRGKVRCCGASTMITKEAAALGLANDLLTDAEKAGAQLIVTACPLCQMNLDAYQPRINAVTGQGHKLPVVYFTQLMQIAFGQRPTFQFNFVSAEPALREVLK
ncbi:MAG TPA: CoB--CoM heterodisulfide reductase iron-sulfur subunit B family protein [Symbiobacteriaceae bacterium]|nr:CoB--CoM heterodisulfide reductase iron-sulfur subunit B family protein [Symbiobacteriaceae bacterium]